MHGGNWRGSRGSWKGLKEVLTVRSKARFLCSSVPYSHILDLEVKEWLRNEGTRKGPKWMRNGWTERAGMTVIGQTKRPRVAAPFTVIHPAPRSFGSSLSAPCLRRSPFGSTSRPLRGEWVRKTNDEPEWPRSRFHMNPKVVAFSNLLLIAFIIYGPRKG